MMDQARTRPYRPSRVFLVAAISVAALLPVAIWLLASIDMRGKALRQAQADERRTVESLAENTLKLLGAQAFVLNLVDQESSDSDCSASAADTHLQRVMKPAARQASETKSIRVLDRNGSICTASEPRLIDDRSRAFREYFVGAKSVAPDGIFVDRAIVGLIDGVPAINVAKPRIRNGTFNGAVLASVILDDLVRYWRQAVRINPTQRIALFRSDGATIARSWQPLVPPPDQAAERRIAAIWRDNPEGISQGVSNLDGSARIGAWRTLTGWDVVVTSSVDLDEALRPWRMSVLMYGLAAAVASVLLAALAWTLLRGQQALAETVSRRTAELDKSLSELREAQRVARIGNWTWDAATDGSVGSDELFRIYGLDPQSGSIPSFREQRGRRYPAQEWDLINEVILRTLRTGEGFELDVRAFRGEEPIWVSARAEVVSDDKGRFVGLRDTGTGMAPNVLARASEPFFTTKGVGQGTGLGLAMSRGFAEQSGGGLHIESVLGRGTVIRLWLPVAHPEAVSSGAAPRPEMRAEKPREARARLLIADDEALVRETLARQMEVEGFVVATASGGSEALTLLDSGEDIDLLVADLSMPGMDGLTLAREARRRRPHLPIVLLTGFASNATDLAMGGALSGAYTLLRKPISGTALAERVAVMLAGATIEDPQAPGAFD